MKRKLHVRVLMVLFIMILGNSSTYANYVDIIQNSEVTIDIKNKSIRTFLEEIQKQTDLDFVYNDAAISTKINKSITVTNAKVNDVLNLLFSGTELTYKVEENIITINRRAEVKSSPVSQVNDKIKVIGKV